MEDALSSAMQRLGYVKLKTEQSAVVEAFVIASDVFAALPTGYGKSLCYIILPFVFDEIRRKNPESQSIVLCISPLVALMKD